MANTTKTPYAVVIFHRDRGVPPIKFHYVKSIYYTHKWVLGGNSKGWVYDYWYMNIYNRKTGQYLGRQYSDNFVIDKPPY